MLWLIRSALNDLMPSGGEMPGISEVDWDDFVQRFREEASWTLWGGLVAGVFVYHLTPIVTVYVPLPAFMLPSGLRDKHADRVTGHRLYLVRQAVFILKLAAGFAWGAHDKVREKLHLDPYEADPGTWRAA